MSRLQKSLIYAATIVLIPGAAAAGWWYYWPNHVLALAEKAVAANDFARAETLLKPLTRQAPDRLQAQLLYAQVLRHLKRPAEAQQVLLRAIHLGLPEADGRREFALDEAVKRFTPNAEKNLLQVVQERPNDAEILQALAEGYAQSQRPAEADHWYTRWLELQPERLETWLERGRVRLAAAEGSSRRIEEAAADFREVLRRSPSDFEGRLNLARCLLKDAHMSEAKEELLLCRRQCPDRVEPLAGLAACALEDRDWDQAEALLHQALDRDPDSTFALGMLGDLCLRRQRFAAAIPYVKRVVALEPRDKAAHLKLAQALRQTGDGDQAAAEERLYLQLLQEGSATR